MANWLAITIGRWIFAWRPLGKAELAHELVHVRQWQRYGLRFIPRYLRASRRAAQAGGDGYRDNRFEVEARSAAEAVMSRRTVHNPGWPLAAVAARHTKITYDAQDRRSGPQPGRRDGQ